MLHTLHRYTSLSNDRCRLNISGSAGNWHLSREYVPDNTTVQTLDVGVNIIRSCMYLSFHCVVPTWSELTAATGSLCWSMYCYVNLWLSEDTY